MITQEQITSALQHLPNQFSIGELIDMLVLVDKDNKAAGHISTLPRREEEL